MAALCQSPCLSHIALPGEPTDCLVIHWTSGKLSPPKCAFSRKSPSDQAVPPQITVNQNELSLNEPDAA